MSQLKNTFNPFSLASSRSTVQLPVLALSGLMLFVVSLVCLGAALVYLCLALVSSWRGYSDHALQWALSFFLLNGVISIALSYRRNMLDSKKSYWRGAAFNTALTMILAAMLLPINPWLVFATLVAYPLMLVYIRNQACVVYDIYPAKSEFNEFHGVAFCIVVIALFGLAMHYAAWLLVPLYGAVMYAYFGLLWYTRRVGIKLSRDQHADVWFHRFENNAPASSTWEEMKNYVMTHGNIPDDGLRPLLDKLTSPKLLNYFDTASTNVLEMQELNDAVELRLCALDAQTSAIFDMYESDKKGAIACLKRLRDNPAQKPEMFDLSNMGLDS